MTEGRFGRMNPPEKNSIPTGESGVAILQVVIIGTLLAILAFFMVQFMATADKENIRIIRRNENITYSTLLSDQVSDKHVVKNLGTLPHQVGADPELQFQ